VRHRVIPQHIQSLPVSLVARLEVIIRSPAALPAKLGADVCIAVGALLQHEQGWSVGPSL
jgi:hypothetical protein